MIRRKVDVAIIGGGPAGLAAALTARESGASVLVLERDKAPGGILQQCIHNGFGLHYFKEELTGPEYAARFAQKVRETDGIEVLCDVMVLEVSGEREILAVSAEMGLFTVEAGAVVLAMGCRERTRGALNIPGSRPAGVYTAGCAQRLHINLHLRRSVKNRDILTHFSFASSAKRSPSRSNATSSASSRSG